MFEQAKPTQLEKANYIRTEFNPSHPRIRMSLIMYLAENGVTPADYETADEFVEMLDTLIEWIGDGMEDFLAEIAELDDGVEDFDPETFTVLQDKNGGETEGYR